MILAASLPSAVLACSVLGSPDERSKHLPVAGSGRRAPLSRCGPPGSVRACHHEQSSVPGKLCAFVWFARATLSDSGGEAEIMSMDRESQHWRQIDEAAQRMRSSGGRD